MRALFIPMVAAVGGLLSLAGAREDDATYHRDIAPAFAQKCVPCHTEGGVAPFPLENYRQVKGRATLIRYVLMQGKMPPLAGDSEMGDLRTVHALTSREMVDFQEWIRHGAPEGTGTATPPPKPEWRLGKPDLVLTGGATHSINAEGAPYSTDIRVPLNLESARRIKAIDFRPKVGKVWRRAMVARSYPEEEKKAIYSPLGLPASRLVGGWGIGSNVWRAPSGAGVEFKPGEDLTVVPLWQPSGRKESAEFELAIYFDDEAKIVPEWQTLGKTDFVIPPQDGFTDLQATTTLSNDVDVLSILPEAKLYARLMRLTATLPNGNEHVLFMVRNWNPEWAGAYNFENPVRLPKGTKLEAVFTYDNSGHALGEERRDPPALRFGAGANDELFWLHVQFVRR